MGGDEREESTMRNGSMRWGGGCPMGPVGDEQGMSIPLIPAPVAFCALMFGLMVGIMIGRKKSMMHGGGMGMMHAHGMSGECGGGDWTTRKRMMGRMAMHHHHHGYGMPECRCDEGGGSAAERAQHPETEA